MIIFISTNVLCESSLDTLAVASLQSEPFLSALKVHASAFYTVGSYSSTTVSKNISAFLTLEKNKKAFYTFGYQNLGFSQDDLGDNYFLEYSLFGKAIWWLNTQYNMSLYGTFDRQNEIPYYSPQFSFYVFGANSYYWISPSAAFGLAYSGGWQVSESQQFSFFGNSSSKQKDFAIHNGTASYIHTIGDGIWFSTSVIVSDSKWAGTYCFVRENITVRFGKHTNMKASIGLGRRTFYLDDELLLLYDQPEVQKGGFSVGGSIGVTNDIGIAPSFEYNQFDDYTVTYVSLGLKYTY